jgi:hypothetical protein
MARRIPLLLLLFAAAAGRAAEPDPATFAPPDAVAFASVKDVRPLIPPAVALLRLEQSPGTDIATRFLAGFGSVVNGRVSLAVFAPEGRGEPDWLFRAPVDEGEGEGKGKLDDLVVGSIAAVLGKGNVELITDRGVRTVRTRVGKNLLHWAVHRGVFFCSAARERVAKAIDPKARPDLPLAAAPNYDRLGEHIDWTGDVTAYVDLDRAFWQPLKKRLERRRRQPYFADHSWLTQWFAPGQFRAAGVSWKGDGKTGSGRLAVLTPKARRGLAALLDLPNAPVKHLDRLPQGCQLFAAWAPVGRGLAERTAAMMGALDPEVREEFETELAEFNKELGVDLGKDLLGNLGPSSWAARLPGAGEPAVFNVTEVRNPAALRTCADALAKYNKTPLRTTERGGRTYTILPTQPAVGYTFDGKSLLFSHSFRAVEEMCALKDSGKTLADAAMFAKLRGRLPKENIVLAAVDLHSASQFALLALTWAPEEIRGDLSTAAANRFLEHFQQEGPGLSLGVALRNEPDAFVLHVESLAGDLWALLPKAAELIRRPVEQAALKTETRRRVTELWTAAQVYAREHDRMFPASLEELQKHVRRPETFLHPASGTRPAEGRFVCDYTSAFERAGFAIPKKDARGRTLMVWPKESYGGDGRTVIFFDGFVQWVDDADFAQHLRNLDRWIAERRPEKKP